MYRKFLLWLSILIVAFIVVVVIMPKFVAGQGMYSNPNMMRHGGMGNGSDAQTIHQLFADRDRIRRTVEEIPHGIRAVTESDSPEVATLIQLHVSKMYDRVSEGYPIPMIGMSSTLPTMIQSANQYQRQLRITSKGIEVTETSNDPNMVTVIREHAREVTQFVTQGMPAMMNGRMR